MTNSNRWFFLLAVPGVWGGLSLLHFQFPGDEYALWAVSSMVGTWIAFVLPSVGDIHQPWIRLSVAGVGALVMAGVGWVLWQLGVRKRLWTSLWLTAAAIILGVMLRSFPSLDRALAKNGSWTAYILSALLLGMYAAALLSAISSLLFRLKSKLRPNPPDLPPTNKPSVW